MNARFLALLMGAMILGAFGVMHRVEHLRAAAPVATGGAGGAGTKPGPATFPVVIPADVLVAANKPAVKMLGSVPDPKFVQRHNYYLQLAKAGGIDGYFVGDSIFDAFYALGHEAWTKQFAGWRLANFACSGDRTQHVLWRLLNGELHGPTPKLFVVLIGTNNLIFNTNEQIVAGNAAILEVIRKTNPRAKILLLGLLPREDEHPEKKPSRIDVINAALAKLADGKTVRFLDVGPMFLDEKGGLRKDLTHDGLHPNAKGYEVLAKAMRPAMEEVLGPPAVSTRKSGG